MRDIFGLAAAVVIALLSQIVEPWSHLWWAAIISSAIIALVAAADLLVRWFVERHNRHNSAPTVKRSLQYLSQRDSVLGPAIISMARYSAWGRWYAAQHLASSGGVISERYLYLIAGNVVMDKILDGDLEVRGRRQRALNYEPIPREHWRSSAFYFVEDETALWKLKICPRGIVQIEPDGTVHASDHIASQRNAELTGYDSLIVDAYQFEELWPETDSLADKKRRQFLRAARKRDLDASEIYRLS